MIPPRQHSRLGPHGQHGTVKGSGVKKKTKRKETRVPVRASSVGATHVKKDLQKKKKGFFFKKKEKFFVKQEHVWVLSLGEQALWSDPRL